MRIGSVWLFLILYFSITVGLFFPFIETLLILFADIRGFTKITEKADPIRLLSQLNEFLALMDSIVKDHRGMTDKFMGDAIMAIFGVTSSDSKHYLDATKSACRMLQVMKNMNLNWVKQGYPLMEIGGRSYLGKHRLTGTQKLHSNWRCREHCLAPFFYR